MGKWIVCSAWPYVNQVPHLGTFIHLLYADVFTRYLRLKGEEVVSVTGSDEHGTPIEVEAIKAGVPPKQVTDEYHRIICRLLEQYGIAFDNYTRTENPVHIRFVQEFYRKVYDNGYVYTETVNLPFCPKENLFLPDRFVEGTCPHCNAEGARGDQCDNCGRVLDPLELRLPHCAFCGTTPVVKSSKHWFFDLPKFASKLSDYIKSNKQLPENARNFSLRWIEEGLKPRALTRDNKWGIPAPFPGAEGKTIYVWLEAVLGYVSATVEWAEKRGTPEKWKEFWFDKETRNVHFLGKDNIPFHTIIFPALLLATRDPYVLPWQVSSTEFILLDGQKFSKSKRVGVRIEETLKVAPAEYWRYILISIRPETRDSNFTWSEFQSRINADLNDALGNFVHRTLTFIKNHFDSKVPALGKLQDRDQQLLEYVSSAHANVGRLLDEFRLRDALFEVIKLAREGNQYLSEREPWHLIKNDRELSATTIHVSAQVVHAIALLLAPFLPATSKQILAQLGVESANLEGSWDKRVPLQSGHVIGWPEPIFKKIETSLAS